MSSNAGDNSAIFVGARDSVASIKRINFQLDDTGPFAIGTVALNRPDAQGVPDSTPWLWITALVVLFFSVFQTRLAACTAVAAAVFSLTSAQASLDNKGTDFIMGFIPNLDAAVTVELHLTADVATTVTVNYPVNSPTFTTNVTVTPATSRLFPCRKRRRQRGLRTLLPTTTSARSPALSLSVI